MADIAGVELESWKFKNTIDLPLSIEEITPSFLSAALANRFPGTIVDDFKIIHVHHGFTTIVRLDLEFNPAGQDTGAPTRLILKGGFEPTTRGIAADFAIGPFMMEVGAYREIKPALGLNMPDCYFAEFDIEKKQMILLMEDLVLRNAKFGHGLIPHTPDQVRRRLTSLAAFHAKSWDDPRLKPGGPWDFCPANGARLISRYVRGLYGAPEVWKKKLELPRGGATAVEFHDMSWLNEAMDYMTALSDAVPNCVIHGDNHAGNLFEEEDGTPGFYDSLPMRTAPMIEVSYLITNVLDLGDRRRNDRALVAHYREELICNGTSVPSLDELMRQFSAFLPFGYLTFMVNENTYQTETFNTAHSMRYSVAMLDHDTKGVIAEGYLPS